MMELKCCNYTEGSSGMRVHYKKHNEEPTFFKENHRDAKDPCYSLGPITAHHCKSVIRYVSPMKRVLLSKWESGLQTGRILYTGLNLIEHIYETAFFTNHSQTLTNGLRPWFKNIQMCKYISYDLKIHKDNFVLCLWFEISEKADTLHQ